MHYIFHVSCCIISVKQASSLGSQILAIAKFWCSNQKYNALDNLICMLPPDVKSLLGNLLIIPTGMDGI